MVATKNATTTAPFWIWAFDSPTQPTSTGPTPIKLAPSTYEICSKRGILLPFMDESHWADTTRAVLYFMALLYSFLGVAVLSEALLRAVERITSSSRKIKVKQEEERVEEGMGNGEIEEEEEEVPTYKEIPIWNPTVANLTLLALANNAPQILLPIIELVGHDFYANDLAPCTVLGSAAFNLFILIPICILSVPSPISKRIRDKRVFITNATWSFFTYIWLIIILLGASPYIIDIWEGALTLVFFGAVVFTGFLADVNMCKRWTRPKVASAMTKEATIVEEGTGQGEAELTEIETQTEATPLNTGAFPVRSLRSPTITSPLDYYDTSEWRDITRSCARQYPELPPYDLAKLVAYRLDNQRSHDRLWYRIRAIKRLTASAKKEAFYEPDKRRQGLQWWQLSGAGMRTAISATSLSTLRQASMTSRVKRATTIEFASRVYVLDPANENRVRLTVIRRGRTQKKAMFRYETVNGTAQRDSHYLYKCETLVFQPGETHKVIHIDIVNGAREWKRRDMLYVKLEIDTIMADEKIRIGQANPAEILYPAWERDSVEVEFARNNVVAKENDGVVRLVLVRKGAIKDSECGVQWATEDVTAVQGKDYEGARGELQFMEGEREKYLDINIIDDVQVEKAVTLAVNITNVNQGAVGANNRAVVTILNDDRTNRFLNTVDQMVPCLLHTVDDHSPTWRDQLMQAGSVNYGDVENATTLDSIAHILAFPWKILRALIPPVNILRGWLTFLVAFLLIALLTTVIDDLASIFSCTVGMAEAVTGVTIVAIGLNLPDLLASRLAAVMDKTADTSIGHVPGINAINVLLGLGLPWFVGSIVWTVRGQPFFVTRPSLSTLSFGVAIFTICSVACYGLLFMRRRMSIFGKAELGGIVVIKWICASVLFFLWCLYALLSSLQAFNIIKGF